MQSVRGIEQRRAARPRTVARDNILPLRDIFSWFRLKSPFIESSPRAGKSADVTKHSNRQLLVLDGDGEARILGNSNPLCEKGWNYDLDTWQSRLRWWNSRNHFRVNKLNYSILMGALFHSRSFGDVFRRCSKWRSKKIIAKTFVIEESTRTCDLTRNSFYTGEHKKSRHNKFINSKKLGHLLSTIQSSPPFAGTTLSFRHFPQPND